jgi:biotin-dependent carboxylase-like uncharacterized protein
MLKLLKSGFFTSIQDGGRFGYLNKGVPVSGFMDSFSATKINRLLENEPDAAVLEITMTGPTIEFDAPTYICLGGAEISVTLNNNPIQHFKVHKIEKGDILSYGKLKKGLRNFLAIKGGLKASPVLASRSQYYPVTDKNCLKDRAEVPYDAIVTFEPKISEIKIDSFLDITELEVSKGPEFNLLNDRQLETVFFKNFKVAKENNRMAYQLADTIDGHEISMLTSATLPGTVQVTPSGRLLILMKDGQTTGGYPRILQLSDMAISILAQKKFGDEISFKLLKV